jgi:hypothetical protein
MAQQDKGTAQPFTILFVEEYVAAVTSSGHIRAVHEPNSAAQQYCQPQMEMAILGVESHKWGSILLQIKMPQAHHLPKESVRPQLALQEVCARHLT